MIVVFIWGIADRLLKRKCKNESCELRYNCVRCGWHYEIGSDVPVDLIFVGRFVTMLLSSQASAKLADVVLLLIPRELAGATLR